jgi:hypothetical protein
MARQQRTITTGTQSGLSGTPLRARVKKTSRGSAHIKSIRVA